MEGFVAFLRDNWKFLVELLVPLVSLVVLCFVRKVKINIPDNTISQMFVFLPGWIKEAESKFGAGSGKEKFKFVFKLAISYLSETLGLSEREVLKVYGEQIVVDIENILSTPQKKGDQ